MSRITQIVPESATGKARELLDAVKGKLGLNIFTNYFNHVAETDIDFPKTEPIVDHHDVCATIPGCDEAR